jgi:hypothetical protein
MPEVPAIRNGEFVRLAPGESRAYRFRWSDHFRYRGRRPVRRKLVVQYSTADAVDARGRQVVARSSVTSNGVWVRLSPDASIALD